MASHNEMPKLLSLNDGRTLCYQTYGALHGIPVFLFHGFPGCRLQAALIQEQAKAANICLIAFDRPGFGLSDPHPQRSILGVADDVVQLADHLGHAQFGLIGVSCGGAYAMATAVQLPDRVNHVSLVAGIGPMTIPAIREQQLPVLKVMFSLARLHRWLAAPLLLPDWLLFRSSADRAVRVLSALLSEPDRALLNTDAAAFALFGASLAEAYRQGPRGAMLEASLIARDRGFELEQISQTVDVHQAGVDRHVPLAMGQHIAQSIPLSQLHLHTEEGHLSILVNKATEILRRFQPAPTSLSLNSR